MNVLSRTDWDPGGSICTSQNNGNNKFDDIRFSHLAEWDLRDTDWLVTIEPCPDTPGIYIPLDSNARLSCLDVMQMKGFRWCTIVCCDANDVPLRCIGVRVAGMGVVASAGAVIQVLADLLAVGLILCVSRD